MDVPHGTLRAGSHAAVRAQRSAPDRLLALSDDYALANGISQLSLRELAAAIYAQALQARRGTTVLLDDVVDAWVEPLLRTT